MEKASSSSRTIINAIRVARDSRISRKSGMPAGCYSEMHSDLDRERIRNNSPGTLAYTRCHFRAFPVSPCEIDARVTNRGAFPARTLRAAPQGTTERTFFRSSGKNLLFSLRERSTVKHSLIPSIETEARRSEAVEPFPCPMSENAYCIRLNGQLIRLSVSRACFRWAGWRRGTRRRILPRRIENLESE